MGGTSAKARAAFTPRTVSSFGTLSPSPAPEWDMALAPGALFPGRAVSFLA